MASDSGAANCYLSFNTGDYNNNWIDFKFDIPVGLHMQWRVTAGSM